MSDQQPDAQRYEQAKTILHKALDLTPAERTAYLDAACGADTELRAEVRSLLDAHEAAGSRFLRGPIARPETETDSIDDDLDLTGQRVGAYRLERLIRRGGMGAVYLAARDDGEFTKHVAIKFIRPSIVTPALLKRFKVERQILADIDHPGIARLIDGGSTESGMPFFIMEYVQGEALDDVLLRGPLPLPRATQLAVRVAEVLEAVHSKGLVYRDLKPSNVMLVAESGVKILDFGIAKIMQGETGEDRTLTEPGWIVGSPPYMSPEQASGGRIDARSDVFSYGVVIFEALTGHLPFSGDTREQYVRNLISAEPMPLPASVPARLRSVIDRCLKKSPAERFSSGGELAYAVRAAIAPAADRKASRTWWVAVAALALVAGALGVWAFMNRSTGDSTTLLTGPPELVATWASRKINPRISPDRRWVSFISDRDGKLKLWLIDRPSSTERSIEPAGGQVTGHLWSPSSDRIAYVYGAPIGVQVKLVITPIADGKPVTIALPLRNAVLVRWIGDRVYYLDPVGGSLWRVDVPSGRSEEVTIKRGSLELRHVDVSADERRIVFAAMADSVSSMWHAALDGSGAVRLTTGRSDPRYVRWRGRDARDVVYVSNEGGMVDVWLLNVTSGRRQPLTVTDAREGQIDVSDDGNEFVYEQIREDARLAVLDPFARSPGVRRVTTDSLSDLLPSAAQGLVAFQRSKTIDRGLGLDDATIRLSRDDAQPEALGDGFAPELSPDGRWVAYLVWNPKVNQLWIRDLQQRDRPPIRVSDAVVKASYNPFPLGWTNTTLTWSPRGPGLFYVVLGPGNTAEIWTVVPPARGEAIRPQQVTRNGAASTALGELRISADGNHLSYLLRLASREVTELRMVDLTRKQEMAETVFSEETVFTERMSFRLTSPGWTGSGAVVALRSDPDMTLTDVILVRPKREAVVGHVRNVTPGSMTLDPRRQILYFTRDGAFGSLRAFSFTERDGQERLVYSGEPHDPVFSGMRVLANGQLIFSFHARRADILSNDFRK